MRKVGYVMAHDQYIISCSLLLQSPNETTQHSFARKQYPQRAGEPFCNVHNILPLHILDLGCVLNKTLVSRGVS